MIQGKCLTCRKAFRWTRRVRLKDAYCFYCGDKLRSTTHLLRWPWEDAGLKVLTYAEAWRAYNRRKWEAAGRRSS